MIKAANYTKLADEAETADSNAAHDETKHAAELILAELKLPLPTAEDLEAAEDWHNSMDKGLIVERVAQWGVDLYADPSRLIATWSAIAMHVFAARKCAGLPVFGE